MIASFSHLISFLTMNPTVKHLVVEDYKDTSFVLDPFKHQKDKPSKADFINALSTTNVKHFQLEKRKWSL